MKKYAQKITVVFVLLIVLLLGVGQFFAFNNLTTQSQNASSTAKTAPDTVVVNYVPEPTASMPVKQGSCWTNSIAAPYRADAWRCTVGDAISDPCFAVASSSGTLLCGANPAVPLSSSAFSLHLTQSLPKPQLPSGAIPKNWAWRLAFADGTTCTPFTGTRPFTADHQAAYYGCVSPKGPINGSEVILGDLDTSLPAWTALVAILAPATSSLPVIEASGTVPVAVVWQ